MENYRQFDSSEFFMFPLSREGLEHFDTIPQMKNAYTERF